MEKWGYDIECPSAHCQYHEAVKVEIRDLWRMGMENKSRINSLERRGTAVVIFFLLAVIAQLWVLSGLPDKLKAEIDIGSNQIRQELLADREAAKKE